MKSNVHQLVSPRGIDANLSPDAFHMWALHYYQCKKDFQNPHGFSPVPYFLLCRATELEIKSRHLHEMDRTHIKNEFRHHLLKAYKALPEEQRILNNEELETLSVANEIYRGKGFEYFNPEHALQEYSQFPNLAMLDSVARRLVKPNE